MTTFLPIHAGRFGRAALCGLLLAVATPAEATKVDQVRSMCAKNPKCSPIPSQPGDKGQDFCIDSAPGGSTCETVVWCPGDGTDCGVIGIVAGQRKRLATVGVDAAMQGRAR